MGDMTETTIRRMREATGLSLREVSRRSGINPGRLSIIERGVLATPDETRRLLAVLAGSQGESNGHTLP